MFRQRLRQIELILKRHDLQRRPMPRARSLQTVQDVMDLLHEQVEAVRGDAWAGTVEKARAIAYVAGIARKTLETGTMAARLEMLELVLKDRKADPKP